jgi:hypothetical protein
MVVVTCILACMEVALLSPAIVAFLLIFATPIGTHAMDAA